MASKLEAEREVKSNAEDFWVNIKEFVTFLPKAFPEQYQSIEVIEGDGKSPGTIILITFGKGVPLTPVKYKIDVVDDASKTLEYVVVEGDVFQYYSLVKFSVSVAEKGSGGLAKVVIDYQKVSPEIPEPQQLIELSIKNLEDVDAYLQKSLQNA